jgi:hypothetical protein
MENNLAFTRRKALGLVAAGLAAPFITTEASAASAPVLVELFTSQGCSSCPPADHLAGNLANQPGVMVVSLNVDYWDYLGWRDTLASPAYTKRQMDYAHGRGDNDVYTPQMVINGAAHVVGSNKGSVESAIANARRSFSLDMSATDNEIKIDMPAGATGNASLWVMSIASAVNVKIERGENIGKTITYHNVVRKLSNVATWNGAPTSISLPRKGILSGDCRSCIAILQKDHVGPIIGIGKFEEI